MIINGCKSCLDLIDSKQGALTESEWDKLGFKGKDSCRVCKIALKHEYVMREYQSNRANRICSDRV